MTNEPIQYDTDDARLIDRLDALGAADRDALGGESVRRIVRASGATARAGSTAPIRLQPSPFSVTPRLRLAAGIAVVCIAGVSAWIATRPPAEHTSAIAATETTPDTPESLDAFEPDVLLTALSTFDDVFGESVEETASAVDDIESEIADVWGEFDALTDAIGNEAAL